MARGNVRVGASAALRRQAGGKLAVGRDSGTRESLSAERAYVQARRQGFCEIGRQETPCRHVAGVGVVDQGTDFAHALARSQGGRDDRFSALWLCRSHHRMMERTFQRGRLLVTIVAVNGVRGFDWEVAQAANKFAHRAGDSTTLAAGFIRA